MNSKQSETTKESVCGMNDYKNEELLGAWLRLSTVIDNERIVSELPYNETLICNILYRAWLQDPEKELTATDLCHETRMLKSLMNRTLVSMEEKGLIVRERSQKDKRRVYIRLDMPRAEVYQQQHGKILAQIDLLMERLGEEKADQLIELLNLTADMAKGVF